MMAFEGQDSGTSRMVSPGGHAFYVEGWTYADPLPRSITFFLDNTAIVNDQYGRPIRQALTPDGRVVNFADRAPDASHGGSVSPRPQFATHAETIEALAAERIDWLSYTVRYRLGDGRPQLRVGLGKEEADKLVSKLIKDRSSSSPPSMERTIACAGWPQLSYEELKKLPELPPTPMEELAKIRDPELRDAALRVRAECPTLGAGDAATVSELTRMLADVYSRQNPVSASAKG